MDFGSLKTPGGAFFKFLDFKATVDKRSHGGPHEHSPRNNTQAFVWGPGRALVDFLLTVGFCLCVPPATQKPLKKQHTNARHCSTQALAPLYIFSTAPLTFSPLFKPTPYAFKPSFQPLKP